MSRKIVQGVPMRAFKGVVLLMFCAVVIIPSG